MQLQLEDVSGRHLLSAVLKIRGSITGSSSVALQKRRRKEKLTYTHCLHCCVPNPRIHLIKERDIGGANALDSFPLALHAIQREVFMVMCSVCHVNWQG